MKDLEEFLAKRDGLPETTGNGRFWITIILGIYISIVPGGLPF